MSLDRIRGTTTTNRDRTKSRQEPAEPAALNRGERALPARLPAKWARDSAGRECILPMFTAHATPCRTFYCAGREVASAAVQGRLSAGAGKGARALSGAAAG